MTGFVFADASQDGAARCGELHAWASDVFAQAHGAHLAAKRPWEIAVAERTLAEAGKNTPQDKLARAVAAAAEARVGFDATFQALLVARAVEESTRTLLALWSACEAGNLDAVNAIMAWNDRMASWIAPVLLKVR